MMWGAGSLRRNGHWGGMGGGRWGPDAHGFHYILSSHLVMPRRRVTRHLVYTEKKQFGKQRDALPLTRPAGTQKILFTTYDKLLTRGMENIEVLQIGLIQSKTSIS